MLNKAILTETHEWGLDGGVGVGVAGSDSKAENGYHGTQILFAFSFGLFVLLLVLYKLLVLLIYEVHVWSAFAWIIVKIYLYFFHMYGK